MKRREILQYGLAGTMASSFPFDASAGDRWGADQGYPTGWAGGFEKSTEYRVGNYSHGFEAMLPNNVIGKANQCTVLSEAPSSEIKYRWGLFKKTSSEYLNDWPVTGLLICRDSSVLFESYRFQRKADMRFTSWSMAKSVTSLLLGICIDKKLIESYDDPAEKYCPELKGTLHGQVTLRNLSNMSSGADVLHARDNPMIYANAFTYKGANVNQTVINWSLRKEDQGVRYNYNELCPLTIGMVIRRVTGMSMSAFTERFLWQPMGGESDARWLTDPLGNEFNCIGFSATLRDWGRLGLLIANHGVSNGAQVVSKAWIKEITSWSEQDSQVSVGTAGTNFGYKAFMWHKKSDGSRLYFNGHHGQRVIVDMPSKTVLVHTAVDHVGNWESELFALFDSVTLS